MPFYHRKRALTEALSSLLNHPDFGADALMQELGVPPNVQLGHAALPCFKMAKAFRKSANAVAADIVNGLRLDGVTAVVAGPYVNFRWDVADIYQELLNDIREKAEQYGRSEHGKNKRVLLEYCSPNIAKKLAFQHIRSTLLGNTLANVYETLGFETERINFVGDWGTQFARLLAAVELWGNKETLFGGDTPKAMDHLFELYVKFHKEADTDATLIERSSQCLQKLEDGDKNALDLWARIRDISVASMNLTLQRMNIRFNHIEGESTYVSAMENTLADIKKRANAKLSDGAWIVEVPEQTTPALIQKRDGTTLYLTRDIAAAMDRYTRFQFFKSYYVVSEQQKLHFQLLFGVLRLMGENWAENCEHLSFGTVLFGAEKMSTREGRVIFLDDILNQARDLALEECTKKNPDLNDKATVAEMVGIGAIIFGELSAHKQRDIEFDWKQILALDGETGPYVQYSAVRCHSLLEKAKSKGEVPEKVVESPKQYQFSIDEESLLVTLGKFRSVLHLVIRDNEPYHLTNYLIDLAKSFNKFYYQHPVLQAQDPIERQLRINLVSATRQVLVNGLNLLGISCPKEM